MGIKRRKEDFGYIFDHKLLNLKFTVGMLKELLNYFPNDSEILIHDIKSGWASLAIGLITTFNPDDYSKTMPYITIDKECSFNIANEKLPTIANNLYDINKKEDNNKTEIINKKEKITFQNIHNLIGSWINIKIYDKKQINFLSYYKNRHVDGIITLDNDSNIKKDIFYPFMLYDEIVISIDGLDGQVNNNVLKIVLDIEDIYQNDILKNINKFPS